MVITFNKKWDKMQALEGLDHHIKKNGGIAGLSRNNASLYQAVLREVGTIKNAVTQLGYEYEDSVSLNLWSHERIRKELLEINQRNGYVRYSLVKKENPKLLYAIRSHFNTVEDAINDLGIGAEVVLLKTRRKWTVKMVLESLNKMNENHAPLSYRKVYELDSGLVKACKDIFGSFNEALLAAEVEISNENRLSLSYLGKQFEKLGIEILKSNGVLLSDTNYVKTEESYILPDAVSRDGKTFYDFKLSSWTVFNSETIKKYQPYCSNIEIIYLRGPALDVNTFKLSSIYDYLDNTDSHLTKKMEQLNKNLKECC